MFDTIVDIKYKTKHGLDTLELMARFLSIIETEAKTPEKEYNRFKSWLVEKLKRGIKPEEDINLAQGIINYIQSDPETNERAQAMKYLFNAEFLND